MPIVQFTVEESLAWHKLQPSKRCASGVVCINPEGKMLAIKAVYKDFWSLPDGITEESESPEKGALRELREELGIVLQPEQVNFGGVAYLPEKEAFLENLYFIFKAHVSSEIVLTMDKEEVEAVAWLTPQEFRNRVPRRHVHLHLAADIAEGKFGVYTEG